MNKKTICISDIHLGSPVCKTSALMELLKRKDIESIVVNGDLIDSRHFKRFSKNHWEILKLLRKLSKNMPVTLVEGNHDIDSAILCEILGLEFVKEEVMQIGERRIGFVHGHQFDFFIKKHPLITSIFANIYYLIQVFDKKSVITGQIKNKSKHWLNASEIVSQRAVKYAMSKKYTDIVCGHVHQAAEIEKPGSPKYWNTGTFCDTPSHFLEISSCEPIIELKKLDN